MDVFTLSGTDIDFKVSSVTCACAIFEIDSAKTIVVDHDNKANGLECVT